MADRGRIDFEPARRFQVWRYSVTYARLSLLSTKGTLEEDFLPKTRYSILLEHVREICLPTDFVCSRVEWSPAKTEEWDRDLKSYTFHGSGKNLRVLATVMTAHEDELEYNDPIKGWDL